MKWILTICIALTPFILMGQSGDQLTHAKIIIDEAWDNGKDITSILLEAEAYTVFYNMESDTAIYMANVWPNSNSQSYGPIKAIEHKSIPETQENYKVDLFLFNWHYSNTYNDESGIADVKQIVISKADTIESIIEIVPHPGDTLIYAGYLDLFSN